MSAVRETHNQRRHPRMEKDQVGGIPILFGKPASPLAEKTISALRGCLNSPCSAVRRTSMDSLAVVASEEGGFVAARVMMFAENVLLKDESPEVLSAAVRTYTKTAEILGGEEKHNAIWTLNGLLSEGDERFFPVRSTIVGSLAGLAIGEPPDAIDVVADTLEHLLKTDRSSAVRMCTVDAIISLAAEQETLSGKAKMLLILHRHYPHEKNADVRGHMKDILGESPNH